MEAYAVEMEAITKVFGDLKANENVNLKVRKGEIHAIVGENGAGKSTLMKILYGMHTPDSGKILINETERIIDSPSAAISLGIGMVHQHFMLVGPLTVLENIILGSEPLKGMGMLDTENARDKINSLTRDFNINVELNAKIESLPVGTQQKVEILKLLYRDASILILDEPTAVLTPQETDDLFSTLGRLKAEGKTIIIITHKLGEVLAVSDSVTVLRHGKPAGELETKKTTHKELANLIIGEDLSQVENSGGGIKKDIVLDVKNLVVLNEENVESVKNISVQIHAGEILGVAGVEGNGQSELVETVTGLRKLLSGSININSSSPQIANIPADRLRDGVVMDFNVAENMILGRQREARFGNMYLMNFTGINLFSEDLMEAYDVRPRDRKAMMSELSGGNQQKAVVARELSRGAGLIVVSHPTRGLDIKAADFVHKSILEQKSEGKAVLLVSSDLSELLKLSDNIIVMYNGKINASLDPKRTNEREIGLFMTGEKTL